MPSRQNPRRWSSRIDRSLAASVWGLHAVEPERAEAVAEHRGEGLGGQPAAPQPPRDVVAERRPPVLGHDLVVAEQADDPVVTGQRDAPVQRVELPALAVEAADQVVRLVEGAQRRVVVALLDGVAAEREEVGRVVGDDPAQHQPLRHQHRRHGEPR